MGKNSSDAGGARFLTVDEGGEQQRLDNFLCKTLKGVPKSHIQKMIREGEVRVNKKRARAAQKLQSGDVLRLPPVRTGASAVKAVPARDFRTVFEDEAMLVIDKPAGVAVHGGSGLSFGVIEQIRRARPELRYLELAHRLDKDTSGLLVIAKKRSALRNLHEQWRSGLPQKTYLALCAPPWPADLREVNLPLYKYTGAGGEKMVRPDALRGREARTLFRVVENFAESSLLLVSIKTGRTHQIRVHTRAVGRPIVGDERYGDYRTNKLWRGRYGFGRMFLHAFQLRLSHPVAGGPLCLRAELPPELSDLLEILRDETPSRS